MEAKIKAKKGQRNPKYSDEVNKEVDRIFDMAIDLVFYEDAPEQRALARQFFKNKARETNDEIYKMVENGVSSPLIIGTIVLALVSD